MTGKAGSAILFKPVIIRSNRTIPVVSTVLSRGDVLGGLKVRWGSGRNDYRVEPGLYGAGSPTPQSPVLATANYKLSFDTLRKELSGIDAWILVLDTKGVNVWCAAGKGTFGTAELVRRIQKERLSSVVSHRTIVVPQLGAVGVAPHEVLEQSGFRVVYGPVRAKDIEAFMSAGMKKDERMRRVRFDLADRLAVAPVELSHAWPFIAAALALSIALSVVSGGFRIIDFLRYAFALVSPIFAGALVFPAVLPWLPFRAFALKGAVLGLAWSIAASLVAGFDAPTALAFVLLSTSVISFIAMNFTGASTYTNLTGATIEVKIGVPCMLAAAVTGLGLLLWRFVLPLITGRPA